MQLWITRGAELSIHQQIVTQISLAIVSRDLAPGQKLPSVRALARRHRIHANTVSAAYHDLLTQGWLELRRGSGLYVRPRGPSALEALLDQTLKAARAIECTPEDVLACLTRMVAPGQYRRLVIAESEDAMFEILHTELSQHFDLQIERKQTGNALSEGSLLIALPTQAIAGSLVLKVNSAASALLHAGHPGANMLIGIVSESSRFRYWARTMLLSAGVAADAICESSAAPVTTVVADAAAAKNLTGDKRLRVFRIVADSAIDEIKRMCRL